MTVEPFKNGNPDAGLRVSITTPQDEYLAFEALAKLIVPVSKKDLDAARAAEKKALPA